MFLCPGSEKFVSKLEISARQRFMPRRLARETPLQIALTAQDAEAHFFNHGIGQFFQINRRNVVAAWAGLLVWEAVDVDQELVELRSHVGIE